MAKTRDELEVVPSGVTGPLPTAQLRIAGRAVPEDVMRVISGRSKTTNLTSYRSQIDDLEEFLTRVSQPNSGDND